MDLLDLIRTRLNESDADLVTWLNTPSIVTRDSSLWHFYRLNKTPAFGPSFAIGLDVALGGFPELRQYRAMLDGDGIDFSLDESQALLEQWGQEPALAEYATIMAAAGRPVLSPWRDAGHAGDVTLDQIAEARAELAAATVFDWWDLVDKQIRSLIGNGSPSIADIKAVVEAG